LLLYIPPPPLASILKHKVYYQVSHKKLGKSGPWNETERINDNSSVSNDVPNASDVENFGDYYKKNPYFDVYDPRNCETLDNKSKDILSQKKNQRIF